MSNRIKKVKQYAAKLREVHPELYRDRTVSIPNSKGVRHLQRVSGKRLSETHARLGMLLEKI